MTRTRLLAVLALFSGALLAGCDPAVSTPTAPATAPRFDFVNGPADLANVIRFSTNNVGIVIVDTASGLIAFEGLPADPSTYFGCDGGQNLASTLNWQALGLLRGVLETHVVGMDVNIHVFRLSDLDDSQPIPILHLSCTATPIAAGTGNVTLVDNGVQTPEFREAKEEHEAMTIQMQGTVTDLRTGQSLHLTAGLHVVQTLAPFAVGDPTVKLENIYVRLNPAGGR
ncbi:MAG TPA: hypothetical protein VLI43_03995 [Gemmatimonadaceae bacterium]|nr:hypothetical protein [Gemmatimonadaceae bacterium]